MTVKELKEALEHYGDNLEVKLDADHCFHKITNIYKYEELVLLEGEY